MELRKAIFNKYDNALNFSEKLSRPNSELSFRYNYSYYPVVFHDETVLLKVMENLRKNEINARRYFYPSLNNLPFLPYQSCPVSEDISKRVLCLPLFHDLQVKDIERISQIINDTII
jgi:dTDP-4-amino-4,6-dideoxygalactose transaminase